METNTDSRLVGASSDATAAGAIDAHPLAARVRHGGPSGLTRGRHNRSLAGGSTRKRSLQSQGGRIGAYRLHATRDPRETTRAARAAFASKFEREVDPDRTLDPTERQRRATAARKAHFTRLALRSAQVRAR
jgi:hypothetical protein